MTQEIIPSPKSFPRERGKICANISFSLMSVKGTLLPYPTSQIKRILFKCSNAWVSEGTVRPVFLAFAQQMYTSVAPTQKELLFLFVSSTNLVQWPKGAPSSISCSLSTESKLCFRICPSRKLGQWRAEHRTFAGGTNTMELPRKKQVVYWVI